MCIRAECIGRWFSLNEFDDDDAVYCIMYTTPAIGMYRFHLIYLICCGPVLKTNHSSNWLKSTKSRFHFICTSNEFEWIYCHWSSHTISYNYHTQCQLIIIIIITIMKMPIRSDTHNILFGWGCRRRERVWFYLIK